MGAKLKSWVANAGQLLKCIGPVVYDIVLFSNVFVPSSGIVNN